jgi:hypothetical protein
MADDRVDLTELDVITRYSLAVRAATADRSELIAALRADLSWLEAGRRAERRSADGDAPVRRAPKKAATARRTTAARRAR